MCGELYLLGQRKYDNKWVVTTMLSVLESLSLLYNTMLLKISISTFPLNIVIYGRNVPGAQTWKYKEKA